ncbi:MAG: hypothetical protein RXO29_04195 [Desulfurococcales archaeon]
MFSGGEGLLTLIFMVRVSPEPSSLQALLDLIRRYKEALNHAIKAVIKSRVLSLGKAHRLLYKVLRERYGYKKMGGSLTTLNASQMTDVIPNR